MTTDAIHDVTDIENRLQELNAALEALRSQYHSINTAKDLEELEQKTQAIGREIADLTVARITQERINQTEFRDDCKELVKNCGKQMIYKGLRAVCIRFCGGTVIRMQIPYWSRKGSAGRRGKGLYPALYLLGIHEHCTPFLASEIALAVTALASLEEALEMLKHRGCFLNVKTIRKITKQFARRAQLSCKMDGLPLPEDHDLKGRQIVASTDGGRLRIRVSKRGRKTKKKRHRYSTDWREPKMIIIYVAGMNGRIDKLFHPLLDGVLQGPDATFGLLYRYLKILNVNEADRLLFVADGALWIWERVSLLQYMLAQSGMSCEMIELIDFYHAMEHLNDFTKLKRGWKPSERQRWIKAQRKNLKSGKIDEVIASLKQAAKGSKSKRLQREVQYFVKNKHRFAYAQVSAAKLPMGSGAMESAIRRVINLRLKGPCVFWNEDTAEEMLFLRSYYKSGRWEQLKTMAYRGGLRDAA